LLVKIEIIKIYFNSGFNLFYGEMGIIEALKYLKVRKKLTEGEIENIKNALRYSKLAKK